MRQLSAKGDVRVYTSHLQSSLLRFLSSRELAQSCGRSGFFVEGNTLRGKYDIPDLSIFVKPLRDLDVDFPRLKLRPKHGLFEMIVDTSNEERSEHKKRRLIFQLRA